MSGTVITQGSVVSVTPAAKRKHRGRPEQGKAPLLEVEESAPEATVHSLSLEELQGMQKDFRRHEGESLTTWLLRCWDNRADGLDLQGREAMQLASLAREGGIDKAIGGKKETQSLWMQILSAVKSRYPFKGDIVCRSNKWTTTEKGIKYLREMAVQEIIHSNPQTIVDPDEAPSTRPLLWKFLQSAPSTYAHSLAIFTLVQKDRAVTVGEVANKLRQLEDSISSSLQACVSAVEKLTEKSFWMEDRFNSLPALARATAIRRRRPFVGSVREKWNTP